ncbi:MAG: glycoside hydrolase family 9 protein [Gaiellales bacterium]
MPALLLAASAAAPAGAASGTAQVRVNQIGYATGSHAKRAYLMSSTSEAGATFSVVRRSGAVVYTAPIGPGLGAWSARYRHVYALDFNAVTAPGTYTIRVAGAIAAHSPAFRIGPARGLYAKPLSNSLSFYQNERDGPDFIPSALRTAPGHLNDGHAMTYLTPRVDGNGNFQGDLTPLGRRIDADGGWWDAGDYLKFVQTTSYTVDLMLIGVRDFPHQMGRGSKTSNFTAEAGFGARWLLRMWNDGTRTLYYQVGIGEGNDAITGDHDIWRLPQADDTYGGADPSDRYIRNRPVFRAGPPGSPISPNLAGRDAAALAEAYQVFRVSHPRFARRCLLAAEHIFDLANTSPHGNLLTVIPYDFYPEAEWRDDMELGATELYLATAHGHLPHGLPHTKAGFYLTRAAHWAHAYITGPNDAADTLNLYDVSGLAHYELYRAIGESGARGLQVTRPRLLADLRKQLESAVAQGTTDPFGFGFPWATWDTTSHGAGLSVMAAEYDRLTHSSAFAADGQEWLANILGANAWGSSFIVGDGSTFPHCLQHQVSNLIASPPLVGAAVEGPNGQATSGLVSGMRLCPADGVNTFAQFNGHHAEWKDDMQSYSNTEPAIDLTASSPLAFAWQMEGTR